MKQSVLAACLAVVLLGGCATGTGQEGVRPFWTLNERDFAAVTPQKTKAEVERMLGKPLLVETFRNLGEEVWDYRFVEGGVRRFAAEVHFGADDRVKYVVTYLDQCTFQPVGCQ